MQNRSRNFRVWTCSPVQQYPTNVIKCFIHGMNIAFQLH